MLRAQGDQCMFGAEARSGQSVGMLVQKPAGFLSNSPCVAELLNERCQGVDGSCSPPRGGHHEQRSGMIASEAQIYPKRLCRAVLKGVTDQLRADGLLKQGCYGIQVADDYFEALKRICGPEQ